MPTNTNLSIVSGDNKTYRLTLQEYIDGTATAINLTGGSVLFTVKESCDDTSATIQKNSDVVGEITLVTPASGIVDVFLVPADTSSLTAKVYVFDVQATISSGEVITCNIGQFTITCDIT